MARAHWRTFVLRTPVFALGAARRAHWTAFVLRTPAFALGAALRAHARLHRFAALAALAAAPLVAPPAFAQAAPAAGACSDFPCGRVLSITQGTVKNDWTPLGTTAVTPVGAQQGRVTTTFQFGRGMTNEGIVVLGAQGGAVYGKSPNSYDKPQWQVTVKLDSGGTRVVNVPYEPYVREGDRVRVAGNNVELAD